MIYVFRSHQQAMYSPINLGLFSPEFPGGASSTGRVPTITLHIAIGIKIASALLLAGSLWLI